MLDPQRDTPYLALTGELWGVICGYLLEIDRVIPLYHVST